MDWNVLRIRNLGFVYVRRTMALMRSGVIHWLLCNGHQWQCFTILRFLPCSIFFKACKSNGISHVRKSSRYLIIKTEYSLYHHCFAYSLLLTSCCIRRDSHWCSCRNWYCTIPFQTLIIELCISTKHGNVLWVLNPSYPFSSA